MNRPTRVISYANLLPQLIAKRRIALLRDLNQFTEAIDALVLVLESSPTDVESWQELAELYFSQNLFKQAIFCLEEVVLITPNAWTVGDQMTLKIV